MASGWIARIALCIGGIWFTYLQILCQLIHSSGFMLAKPTWMILYSPCLRKRPEIAMRHTRKQAQWCPPAASTQPCVLGGKTKKCLFRQHPTSQQNIKSVWILNIFDLGCSPSCKVLTHAPNLQCLGSKLFFPSQETQRSLRYRWWVQSWDLQSHLTGRDFG